MKGSAYVHVRMSPMSKKHPSFPGYTRMCGLAHMSGYKIKEKTYPCLIQTGVSFSLILHRENFPVVAMYTVAKWHVASG